MPLLKAAAAYKPDAGSLAARVIDVVSRNQDDDYTSRDIAVKFNVVSSSVQALLHSHMSHGLLSFERSDTEGVGKVWRAGANLREWLALQADAPMTLAALAATPSARSARAAASMRRIDPLKVTIRSGVPVPALESGRALTAPYAVLWERMKPNDCVELPTNQASSLLAYLRKNKQPHTVRTTAIGAKTIWRQA
jgi:hypothetical protein